MASVREASGLFSRSCNSRLSSSVVPKASVPLLGAEGLIPSEAVSGLVAGMGAGLSWLVLRAFSRFITVWLPARRVGWVPNRELSRYCGVSSGATPAARKPS